MSTHINEANIYSYALQGNLKPVLNEMIQVSDNMLTPKQVDLKKKYVERFIKDLPNSDETILTGFAGKISESYKDYWRKVLRQDISIEEGYHYLFERLSIIAAEDGVRVGSYGDAEIEKLMSFITMKLKSEGYYSQLGRTKPHLDLLLWKKENLVNYPINLGDVSLKVQVVMMDDFKVQGWLGYATFNYKSTSGWADREKLFCVKSKYDLNSEKFTISYLSHEGRHFSDYKKFPKLGPVDLEYRAKLTELSLANETNKDLLQNFFNEASGDSKSAHASASFHLMQNMAKALGLNIDGIQNVEKKIIQEAALKLLMEHTNKLESLGADTSIGIYN